MNQTPLAIAIITLGICSTVQAKTEEQCQQDLNSYMGMQRHLNQSKHKQLKATVGFKEKEIQELIQNYGACNAWQKLELKLQRQHADVLDFTEKKTGLPSPKR